MDYSQIDNAYVLGLVQTRIRELEGAHAHLSLRIETPTPGDVITEQDRANLQMLEESLAKLRRREGELRGREGDK